MSRRRAHPHCPAITGDVKRPFASPLVFFPAPVVAAGCAVIFGLAPKYVTGGANLTRMWTACPDPAEAAGVAAIFTAGMQGRSAGVVVHEAAHLAFDKRVDG